MAEDGSAAKIVVMVKPTASGGKFQIEVDPEISVLDMKAEVAKTSGMPPASEQRLIYKGQILKDEKKISEYGIKSEHVVHMVAGKSQGASQSSPSTAAPSAATPSVASANDPFGSTMNMMNDPAFQQFLNNPEFMRSMLQSNPVLQQLIERNPELGQILNDPATLRQTMQVATNPSLMREQMRNADRALSNIEGMPEGFNALRRIYETIQEPLMNAATNPSTGANANPMAALFGNTGAPGDASTGATANPTSTSPQQTPNAEPLPNPWAPATPAGGGAAPTGMPPGMDMGGFGGLGGMMGGAGGQPDMASMMQMMENPMVQQMLSSMASQPGFMENIINSNPQVRGVMDANPAARAMMSNPELMRQMMQPQNMQAMMRMQQAMGGGGGMGGMSIPGLHPAVPGGASPAGGLNVNAAGGGGLADMMAMMQQMGGMGGMGMGGGADVLVPPTDPETTFATQLQQLQDMGFYDKPTNIAALTATGGNVNAAVERLLSGP